MNLAQFCTQFVAQLFLNLARFCTLFVAQQIKMSHALSGGGFIHLDAKDQASCQYPFV